MAKVLRCGDLMPGCNTVIEGMDEAEVMAKGAEHAKAAHNMGDDPGRRRRQGQGGYQGPAGAAADPVRSPRTATSVELPRRRSSHVLERARLWRHA